MTSSLSKEKQIAKYDLNAIQLLNGDKLLLDMNNSKKSNVCGKLVFTKTYAYITPLLYETSLIADLINIVMIYVNDEIYVSYEIANAYGINIYCKMTGSIWFDEYNIWYAYYIGSHYTDIYFSKYNNIFRNNSKKFYIDGLDGEYKLYVGRKTSTVECSQLSNMPSCSYIRDHGYEMTCHVFHMMRMVKKLLDDHRLSKKK